MSLIQIWWLLNEVKDDKHCTIWLYYYSHQFCDSLRKEFDSIKPYIYRVQPTVIFEDYRLRVDFQCRVCMKLKPDRYDRCDRWEKKKVQRSQRSQWSYGNHSPAIAAISSDHSDNDCWDRKSSFSGIVVVCSRPLMPCLYFIFARTYVKITRKWKSIYPRHNI